MIGVAIHPTTANTTVPRTAQERRQFIQRLYDVTDDLLTDLQENADRRGKIRRSPISLAVSVLQS
jgi:hypothetical protein